MSDDDWICAICRESVVTPEKPKQKLINCVHSLHPECLAFWLKVRLVCPVCNAAVAESEFPPVSANENSPLQERTENLHVGFLWRETVWYTVRSVKLISFNLAFIGQRGLLPYLCENRLFNSFDGAYYPRIAQALGLAPKSALGELIRQIVRSFIVFNVVYLMEDLANLVFFRPLSNPLQTAAICTLMRFLSNFFDYLAPKLQPVVTDQIEYSWKRSEALRTGNDQNKMLDFIAVRIVYPFLSTTAVVGLWLIFPQINGPALVTGFASAVVRGLGSLFQ